MSSSRLPARLAVLFGLLALAAMPAGAAAAQRMNGVGLLESLYVSVPTGFALGLIAWIASRKARFGLERTVYRQGAGTVRLGRFLAWAGLYVTVTGAGALVVYAVLRAAQ
jgi:hypothetical protein